MDLYPKHNPARLTELIQTFIIEEKYTPKDPPPYVAAIFSPLGRNIVSMISCVLGYSTSEYIDEIILAFMSIYILGQPPATIYDFVTFIADRMHEQFLRMSIERIFKYTSVLYHLFLCFQVGKFPTYLAKIGHQGPTKISHLWTPLIHQFSSPYSYNEFIDSFFHPVMTMLSGTPQQIINPKIRRFLHLNINHQVGDWYLYQNHTEIRIYGCQLAPYKLLDTSQ